MRINGLISNKKIFYFAHRGAPMLKQENTVESFSKAIELGCNGIEMDVQLTKDNKIIIFHDNYILHNKHKHQISKLSYDDIKKLCKDMQIINPPLFKEAVPLIRRYPEIIFNIEIKSHFLNNYPIIYQLKQILSSKKLTKQCVLSSFNYSLLLQLKLFFSNANIAFILGGNQLTPPKKLFIYKLMIKFLQPTFVHPNGHFLNSNFCKWLHKNQFIIHAYTINDTKALNKMLELGVSGIFTDNHQFYSNN